MTQVTALAEAPKQAPVEPVAPEAQAPLVKEDPLSSKFASLAKKEKWLKKMMDDVNKQKKDVEARESEYKTNFVDKKRIKENFLEVALEAGLTPDSIANMLLNQPQGSVVDPTIREMRAEIEALKQEVASAKNGMQDKQKTERAQAVAQIREDAEMLLSSEGSTFEALKLRPNAADLITQFIEETYDDEGRVLKVEQVATMFEEQLLEQAIAMAKLKKVQEKAGLAQALEAQPKTQQTPQQHKTLTNGMVSSSTKTLTAKEKRTRAIMRAQGLDPDAVQS